MIYLIGLSLLSLLPIALWLIFFLRCDLKKPEPWFWILIVFGAGIALAPLILLLENYYYQEFSLAGQLINNDFYIFLGVAIIEEMIKFIVAYVLMKLNPYFDEPVDAMVYMVVIALGFASIENLVLVAKEFLASGSFWEISKLLAFRFLGANLLHIICSGLIGFFWAWRLAKRKRFYYFLGFALAIGLHTIFNFVIMEWSYSVLFPVTLTLFVFFLILYWFFNLTKHLRPAHLKSWPQM